MIRKTLLFTVLAVAAAVAAVVLPLWKSDAAPPRASTASTPASTASAQTTPPRGLSNFDTRLIGRGEFNDMDLGSPDRKRVV